MERKLAAILAADVVGYSKLMAGDETGTLAALKTHRRELFDPLVAEHGGRIVKLMGDGALIEFPSVVDAVNCAVTIQRRLAALPANVIVLRIGINLGDVIVEGEDIYGDGVNIAARLEEIASPGGVCLSAIVHESIAGRSDASFSNGGDRSFKNIDRPIRVFHWPAREEKNHQASAHALADKPSIAVLPFDNMSSDPDQVFFAEGIAEDIITELSKFRSLFVIARNSSFAFKGKGLDIKAISAKLGVRYVVEGSVRRAGKRVRITAQLIDALDDVHLWAERYDRDLEDIFAVQDEVTAAIVTAIEPEMLSSERQRALRKPPESLDAWENYQRGLWHVFRYKGEEREAALGFMERAIALDPTFASAHAGLSYGLYVYVLLGSSPDRDADVTRALGAAKMAASLDNKDPFAYAAMARCHTLASHPEDDIEAADRAIAINPNFPMAHFARAHGLWHCGRAAEALASHDEAIRLTPHDPMIWIYFASKAIALVMIERHEEAIAWSRKSQQQPNAAIFAHLGELSGLGHMDRSEDFPDALRRARLVMPEVSIAFLDQVLPITHAPSRELFHDGLRKAGLPETAPVLDSP